MKVVSAHIPVNPNSRPGDARPLTRAVIYHWTGVPGQRGEQVAEWFASLAGTSDYGSAHYAVDDKVYEIMPPREIAYHSGTANAADYKRAAKDVVGIPPWRFAIGIEMCVEDSNGQMNDKTIENALVLGKELCLKFSLDPWHCVYRHHDMTGKICPKWFVDHPDEWVEFVEKIEELVIDQIEFDRSHHGGMI